MDNYSAINWQGTTMDQGQTVVDFSAFTSARKYGLVISPTDRERGRRMTTAMPCGSKGSKMAMEYRRIFVAFAALLVALSAFSSRAAYASDTQGSITPLYYCIGGMCTGWDGTTPCPHGAIGALRSCSEAHFYEVWPQLGSLTLLYVIFNSYGEPTIWWSNPSGTYSSILGVVSGGQDVPDVDRNLGFKGCGLCGGTMVGNPINLLTGNKFEDESDYEGQGLFPLLFHRFYNSASSGDGTIGIRWSHTYSRTLIMQSQKEVKLYRDDGEIRYFEQCGSAWCATADEIGTLIEKSDSSGHIMGWQYTDEHNVMETYDGSGRFLSEADNTGLAHTLTYDSSGRLSAITDSFGRSVTLGYNVSNLISQLTFPSGQAIAYAYDSSGNLSTVTYPGNLTRTYFYNESGNVAAGASSSLLTGIHGSPRINTMAIPGQP